MLNIELNKICQALNCINHNNINFLYQYCASNGLVQNSDRNRDVLKDEISLSRKIVS
jgi:hypothetical protein